jgi:murein DD-endopeptidase MepM/ murein hydrolase activator NlpD
MRKRLILLGVLAIVIAALAYVDTTAGPVFRHPLTALRLIRSSPPSNIRVPVQGVSPSQLRDSWGAPRSGGRHHQGIDIFAPRGREIVSSTRGIIVTVGTNTLGGRIVRVLGPGGYWHYYAHLERFADIRAGDIIGEGRVLGYVGDSGNARGTPPHLHYGIYRFRGGAINPYPLLLAVYNARGGTHGKPTDGAPGENHR